MNLLDKLKKNINCFGYDNYSPLTVFIDVFEQLKNKIEIDNSKLLFAKRPDYFEKLETTCLEALEMIKAGKLINQAEEFVENQVNFKSKNDSFINEALIDRTNRISIQIANSLNLLNLKLPDNSIVLDLGGGNGRVLKGVLDLLHLSKGLLTDVLDYRDKLAKEDLRIGFTKFEYPFDYLNVNEQFDLLIMTNVLHHCDDPFKVFRTGLKYLKTNGIIVVIESCIDLETKELEKASEGLSKLMPFQNIYNNDGSINNITEAFLTLNPREMRLYGSFFDWVFNRLYLDTPVNVPCNFGKPSDWNLFFKSCDLKIIDTLYLGFDQPAALEFHTLHILKKK